MATVPNVNKFQPKRQIPRPPQHLQPNTRKWWSEIVGSFELESHHLRLLTLAAESWDRCVQARETLAREGLTYTTKGGEPRRHPCAQIEQDAKISFTRILRELALDVSAPGDDSRPPGIRR